MGGMARIEASLDTGECGRVPVRRAGDDPDTRRSLVARLCVRQDTESATAAGGSGWMEHSIVCAGILPAGDRSANRLGNGPASRRCGARDSFLTPSVTRRWILVSWRAIPRACSWSRTDSDCGRDWVVSRCDHGPLQVFPELAGYDLPGMERRRRRDQPPDLDDRPVVEPGRGRFRGPAAVLAR